jgi:hypothetical protein
MRSRAWRRHIEEVFVIRRLKIHISGTRHWSWLEDANKNYYKKSIIVDFLEKEEYFHSKTITTSQWDSRSKVKYSPNRSKPYYRDGKKRFENREFNKFIFYKILKENGLK